MDITECRIKHHIRYAVDFAIYNSIYNLPKVIKYGIENKAFPIFIGFQNVNEDRFHVFWKFGNLALERLWK